MSETPDADLKEQDEGIIEVFSKHEHDVLTVGEIAEDVSITKRQVRRRLRDLSDRGVVGVRKTSGRNLAWLEEDVGEPITVRYPLLRFVRDRLSVQFFVVGASIGIFSSIVFFFMILGVSYGMSFDSTLGVVFSASAGLGLTIAAILVLLSLVIELWDRRSDLIGMAPFMGR